MYDATGGRQVYLLVLFLLILEANIRSRVGPFWEEEEDTDWEDDLHLWGIG